MKYLTPSTISTVAGDVFRWAIAPALRDAMGSRDEISRTDQMIRNDPLHGAVAGAGYGVEFSNQLTSAEEALRRLLAHVMIVAMPPEGLGETVECLSDVIEFHQDRVAAFAAPKKQRSIERRGRVTDVTDRSPLTIAD